MNVSEVSRRLRGAAVTVALAVGAVGSAHAIIYTGSWDPLFGLALPDLSFSGQASIYIPDACIARAPGSSSGFVSNFSSCTGSIASSDPMRLISAEVTLTDIRQNGPSETLDFITGAGYSIEQLAAFVRGVYIDFDSGGVGLGSLIGASTSYIGAVPGTIEASKTGGTQSNNFYLAFGPDQRPAARGFGDQNAEAPDPAAPFRTANILAVPATSGSLSDGTRSNLAQVTFRAVPEPSSVVLVLAALALLGIGGASTRPRG